MIIRQMTAADLPVVSLIDALSFSQPWPPTAFEVELSNNDARSWVVEQDGQVIAALILWRVLDEAHIATIAVHPDFRRRGIGALLLQAAMKDAYIEGARIYHLEVRASNLAAQKMYMKFGYDIVGIRRKYYKDNGEDALLMTLDLSQPNPANSGLDFLPDVFDERSRNSGTDSK